VFVCSFVSFRALDPHDTGLADYEMFLAVLGTEDSALGKKLFNALDETQCGKINYRQARIPRLVQTTGGGERTSCDLLAPRPPHTRAYIRTGTAAATSAPGLSFGPCAADDYSLRRLLEHEGAPAGLVCQRRALLSLAQRSEPAFRTL
jgi:hypothetical protein